MIGFGQANPANGEEFHRVVHIAQAIAPNNKMREPQGLTIKYILPLKRGLPATTLRRRSHAHLQHMKVYTWRRPLHPTPQCVSRRAAPLHISFLNRGLPATTLRRRSHAHLNLFKGVHIAQAIIPKNKMRMPQNCNEQQLKEILLS